MAKAKKKGIHAVPDERNLKDPNRKVPAKPRLPSIRIIDNIDIPISELSQIQRCELIAEISESILEDPEAAIITSRSDGGDEEEGGKSSSKSKMNTLLDLANPMKNSYDQTTTRLAILSLLAIFQDIIPSYRIRLPTAAEMSVQVAKDTKKVWDYEKALLASYQRYLKLLDNLWESGCGKQTKKKDAALSEISVTAILCLCELLKSATHFNFRSNILSIIVKQTSHRTCEEVSDSCCGAISHVFKEDKQGDVALEAARSIAKMIKERYEKGASASMSIRPAVVRTFLSLPLRVHEDEAQAAKLAEQAKAKMKKKDRNELDDVDEEMKEGDATVDKIVLAKSQADTLHAVTLTYFRIIKGTNIITDDDRTNTKQKKKVHHATTLLAPALEGLAKFSHLINFDTVHDVLTVLKGLMKNVETMPLDASLNCVLTAFQTLQGPGRELQIDQKEYVSPLYSQLPRLVSERNDSTNTELALKCLYFAFIKRKEYSNVRVAAFAKQLSTVAMHAPSYTSAPLLAFLQQLLHRYPSAAQLLENEEDVVTQGTYTPNAEDPEYTNPFATSAWELGVLKFHINPEVAHHARGAGAKRMLQLPAEDPTKILAEMVRNSRELHIAHRISKKKHPLATKGKANKTDKRRRIQARFITPRTSQEHHLLPFT
mmetsp:Transcript_19234/g.28325  ORF Transcript_19234/g.28325 Transcript_19234/m.28325 type:complete len:657 (-) Transcript_19234:37-2007(-)